MAKIQEVPVPDIGDFDEVVVVEVLVSPGDRVEADQSLITLESDKASMEVPSPVAGVVKELKVSPGDKIGQGAVILTLEVDESKGAGEVAAEKTTPAETTPAETTPEETTPAQATPAPASGEPPQGSSDAALSSSGEESTTTPRGASAGASPPEPQSSQRAPVPSGDSPAAGAASAASPTAPVDEEAFAKAHASPAVRRYARELGVDLGKVTGTGRKGRILQEDIQGFVKKAVASPAGGAAGSGLALPEMPAIDFSKFGEVEVQPLSRIQKIGGTNLSRAWVTVPHVTQFDEADITEMEAFRKEHGEAAKAQGLKLTPVAFLLKATAKALLDFPTFNASLSPDRESLILKKYVHIGVAVDTPKGLIVPVIRDVDKKGLFELAKELGETSARARDGKLTPKDLSGGCFSISSLGGIGGTAFTPIVNAPEVAILGVSRSSMKPVWQGGEFVPRLILPLSLSYDHRVIDGAAAARFTVHLSGLLGDLRRLLL